MAIYTPDVVVGTKADGSNIYVRDLLTALQNVPEPEDKCGCSSNECWEDWRDKYADLCPGIPLHNGEWTGCMPSEVSANDCPYCGGR